MQSSEVTAGWIPVQFFWEDGQPWVKWRFLGDRQFLEPFFHETVRKARYDETHGRERRLTGPEALRGLAAKHPGATPAGFIFHQSRCGSTLLTQMLSAVGEHVVISEAGPVDEVLRGGPSEGVAPAEAQQIEWLQWLLAALGHARTGREQRLFVKFDSWHTAFLPLIQRAFPEVPWVFVYRNPVEILVSHHRQRGSQTVPGLLDPGLFGLEKSALAGMPFDEYAARVLASIARAALANSHAGKGRLVNYSELPALMLGPLLEHFGLERESLNLEAMRQASQFYSKKPHLPFVNDVQVKRQLATPALAALSAAHLDPLYQWLEAVRGEQIAESRQTAVYESPASNPDPSPVLNS